MATNELLQALGGFSSGFAQGLGSVPPSDPLDLARIILAQREGAADRSSAEQRAQVSALLAAAQLPREVRERVASSGALGPFGASLSGVPPTFDERLLSGAARSFDPGFAPESSLERAIVGLGDPVRRSLVAVGQGGALGSTFGTMRDPDFTNRLVGVAAGFIPASDEERTQSLQILRELNLAQALRSGTGALMFGDEPGPVFQGGQLAPPGQGGGEAGAAPGAVPSQGEAALEARMTDEQREQMRAQALEAIEFGPAETAARIMRVMTQRFVNGMMDEGPYREMAEAHERRRQREAQGAQGGLTARDLAPPSGGAPPAGRRLPLAPGQRGRLGP